jgi:hypothetical protein
MPDVSGQSIGPILSCQESPKKSWPPEDGTDRLSRNVGNKLPPLVITQKSAVLIYFAVEAWNHARLTAHRQRNVPRGRIIHLSTDLLSFSRIKKHNLRSWNSSSLGQYSLLRWEQEDPFWQFDKAPPAVCMQLISTRGGYTKQHPLDSIRNVLKEKQ